MSWLANARHDRAAAHRARMAWCLAHDRTLNGEKRSPLLPILLSTGIMDAYVVLSKHRLDAMQCWRQDYRTQLEAHEVTVQRLAHGGRWVRIGERLRVSWDRHSDLPDLRTREAYRWEWAR